MPAVSPVVKKFFEDYENGLDALDPELLVTQYAESFMFAGPQGAQAIKRDDFLKVLPKRSGFFKALGLTSSKIHALEETHLDDSYILVKVYWSMRFEKDPRQPISTETSATYILFQQQGSLQIVFQLDHQDLTKTARELGLLPQS